MATIEEKHKGMGDYYEFVSKIYDEYFDNRAYLIEQYLDALSRILETTNYTLHEYVTIFLSRYLSLMKNEKDYFDQQFGNQDKFTMFR